jgi:hypothetical protein
MEYELARIFGALVQSKAEGATRAYGCVASFIGRKDMVAMAFECYPKSDDPIVACFPKILDDAVEFCVRRNEIAHGIVQEYSNRATGGYGPTSRGFYLIPPPHGSKKHSSLKARKKRYYEEMRALDRAMQNWPPLEKYAYTSAQINSYRHGFSDLRERLWPIADRLYEITAALLK